jgi:selenide,water dikinase
VWKLKDWIDQRWMRKYQELPSMDESSTSAPASANGERGNNDVGLALQPKKVSALAMRCGGCGSKVASPIVRRVLDRLTEARGPHSDPRVLVGLQGSDDAAVLQIPAGELLVQSVDHFRTFIDDPYIFARVTTNHCLSDLFAMGATTHSAQALVSLPFADDAKIENDLTHLLAGVTEALGQANAPLVGGHTAEGPELSLGLSVNGTISPAQMLTKGAMAPGDKLVLTKGLGSGVIFAADMRALAGADVVSGALTVMLQSNQDAANTLTAHGVRACTDVTGFGLAGHLVEMLRASAMDATVSLDEVALLHGAQALFEQGLRSTLHVGNATFGDRIQRNGASDVHLATLFDPQTSGGLLASVPAAQADACVNALRAQGYAQTCIIGEVRSVPMKDLPQAGQIHLA